MQEDEDADDTEEGGVEGAAKSSAKIRNRGLKSARKSSAGDKTGATTDGTVTKKLENKEDKRKKAEAAKVSVPLTLECEQRGRSSWSLMFFLSFLVDRLPSL